MLLKTKDQCGKLGGKAGMYMKTKEIHALSGNVMENKRVRHQMGGGKWAPVRLLPVPSGGQCRAHRPAEPWAAATIVGN
jgi:hypothetical protein